MAVSHSAAADLFTGAIQRRKENETVKAMGGWEATPSEQRQCSAHSSVAEARQRSRRTKDAAIMDSLAWRDNNDGNDAGGRWRMAEATRGSPLPILWQMVFVLVFVPIIIGFCCIRVLMYCIMKFGVVFRNTKFGVVFSNMKLFNLLHKSKLLLL